MRIKNFFSFALVLFAYMQITISTVSASGTPKKSTYKRILNEYCNYYLSSCFDGVEYIDRSIWIKDVSPIDMSNTLIEGIFAYRDYSNKKHRAIKFLATVTTAGAEVQRITFKMERPSDMTHTQAYWEECSQLFGKAEQQVQQKKYYTQLLNDFCAKYYSSCFSRRTFERNSIVISRIENDDQRDLVIVYGTHNYTGRTGSGYRNYKFEARIQESEEYTRIEFKKESAPDLMHSNSYWEQCTKTFSY